MTFPALAGGPVRHRVLEASRAWGSRAAVVWWEVAEAGATWGTGSHLRPEAQDLAVALAHAAWGPLHPVSWGAPLEGETPPRTCNGREGPPRLLVAPGAPRSLNPSWGHGGGAVRKRGHTAGRVNDPCPNGVWGEAQSSFVWATAWTPDKWPLYKGPCEVSHPQWAWYGQLVFMTPFERLLLWKPESIVSFYLKMPLSYSPFFSFLFSKN